MPDVPRSASFRRRALAASLAAVLFASAAAAEWLAPLTTETAATLSSGTAEVGLGASYFRNRRYPPFTPPGFIESQNLFTVPELAGRIAAGSWAEIQASYEFIDLDEHTADGVDRNNYGGGDARLFTKVRILRERQWVPSLGVRFGTKLPNANKGNRLGTDETDFFIAALASKDFGPLAAHVNLGVAILGNPGPVVGDPDAQGNGQDDLFTYAVALTSRRFGGVAGPWDLQLLGEINGTTGSRFDNDGTELRAGVQLQRGGLNLYAGVGAGLSGAAEDVGAMAGVLYAFELERLADLFEGDPERPTAVAE